MAAPTPTPTHSVPPSTSPGPAVEFPYTFMHNVLSEMLLELKAVRKELQDMRRPEPVGRKRKRPGPTSPCALCRLSRTPCIAGQATEACVRCMRKQVECFDDTADPPRVRQIPEESSQSDDEWPKRKCADCHARKRKCPGASCPARANAPGPSTRSPNKPCADCRARKRRCTHEGEEQEPEAPEEPRWYPPPPPAHWYPDQRPYPPFADRPYPPHGLHPPPHARLPPAPDMRHPAPAPVPDPNHHVVPRPSSAAPTPGATPAPSAAPAPAGRKGRACLACRKLKMRCVAPTEDGGPDERCQRCERAGLECVYVDRKRRGPGAVFPPQDYQKDYKDPVYDTPFDPQDPRSAKKPKREGSPSNYDRLPLNPRLSDVHGSLDGSFADEDPDPRC